MIVIDDKNYIALTNLGRVYLHLNKPSTAEMYLSQSLSIKQAQPIAISLLSITHCQTSSLRHGYKIIDKAINFPVETPSLLLYVIRACISYYYVREKKGFNEYYKKHKMVLGIGNGVTLDDIDEQMSDDELVIDSNEEGSIGAEESKDNDDVVSQGDVSIGFQSESGGANKWISQIDEVISMIQKGKRICNLIYF